jgi:UDP-glucose 4-epimerase
MSRVLVTGGAGFIGSNTVDALISQGYDVYVVDDLSTGKKKNLNSGVSFHRLDIRSKSLEKAFKSEKPDYVIHLAAQINVRESIVDPVADAQKNVLGSINLLDMCSKYGVGKIVYSSSGGAVYGEPIKNPVSESHQIAPLSPYGASKYCVEKYIELYSKSHGIDYNILRYGNVYGPRQDPLGEAGVVAIFTRQMMEGQRPCVFGDGRQSRDFCFVGDVAKANLVALKRRGKSKIYNVGSGEKTSVNEIIKHLKAHNSAGSEPFHGQAIAGEVRHIFLDISLISRELRWKPKISLADGICETVGWYKKCQK